MKLVRATAAECEAMARAHALAFDKPWREDEFEDLLEGQGIYGFLADDAELALGVILCRMAGAEVEVLTVGVTPRARRRGVALALMLAALEVARQAGTVSAFLEVAVDNDAAIPLYARMGFARTGLRKAYYDRGPAGTFDALVMRLDLTRGAA